MREWQDISVAARVKLPAGRTDAAGCVATRVEQMWRDGVVLCVGGNGVWNLTIGGPPQNGLQWPAAIVTGKLAAPVTLGEWHSIALTTNGDEAKGSWDGAALFSAVKIRTLDTGFAALGTNLWLPVEFDDIDIKQVGDISVDFIKFIYRYTLCESC